MDWTCLAVELVELTLEGDEADEVEDVIIFFSGSRLFVDHEGVLASEAVVSLSDLIRVSESHTLVLRWEALGELAKIGQFRSKIDNILSVEQNGQDSLGSARIIDDLIGEEELIVIVR